MKKTLLCTVVFLAFVCVIQAQTNNRSINIDVAKVQCPLNTFFNECVGAGRANEGLRADWQHQLRYAKEQLGFRYIRMHGLLHDDMGVYFEDKQGNPTYNWQYIDVLYDSLLSIGIRPFVEFGFMPKALASGTRTVFWWTANVSPPKDYDKWGNLIKALVQHWTERYGEAELKHWYFEVWNEPNLSFFWSGTQADYFHLYNVTANAVKSVSKDYRVGGPATAEHAWIPELINYCVQNKVPMDFASTHTYGIDKGAFDATGVTTYLSKRDSSVWGSVVGSRKEIQQSPMPKLELHYTEWSASYTPNDPIHDSYHEAAYVLEKLKKTGDAANSMSYWTFTDIFEENGPRTTPFHGGFGLINYQGINKPAFYAYQFLNRLGNQQLQNTDAASWACKDAKGNVQVLLWDFTNTHPGDSVSNQVYYKRNLPSKSKGKITISCSNLAAGKYELRVYKTGYRVNDPYTAYFDIGSPGQLTRQQVQAIKQKNNGEPIISKTITIDGSKSFSEQYDLRENDVLFVTLNKQ
ncbi:MAG TPA: glycoside hydrolase [Mucilaginibacter sp.]|jgi:xylan 1,4-beta-xylosidase